MPTLSESSGPLRWDAGRSGAAGRRSRGVVVAAEAEGGAAGLLGLIASAKITAVASTTSSQVAPGRARSAELVARIRDRYPVSVFSMTTWVLKASVRGLVTKRATAARMLDSDAHSGGAV